jgi:hypothetical protein
LHRENILLRVLAGIVPVLLHCSGGQASLLDSSELHIAALVAAALR